MKFKLPKLYPITDVRLSGMYAEQLARLAAQAFYNCAKSISRLANVTRRRRKLCTQRLS